MLTPSSKTSKDPFLQHIESKKNTGLNISEILNRPPPVEDADIPVSAADDLFIDIVVPKKEEIIKTIKSLKNGKAPGHDNLNAELFKAVPELTATILQPLFFSYMGGRGSVS